MDQPLPERPHPSRGNRCGRPPPVPLPSSVPGRPGHRFPAKGGQQRTITLTDPDVCRAVTALRRRTIGDHLFAYWGHSAWHDLHAGELNAHLTGLDVTANDFRTWHATVLAAVGLAVSAQDEAGHTISRHLPELGSDTRYGLPGTQGDIEKAVLTLLRTAT
ncbi:hypothetical protein [Streptacidiphilus cavernicola]|uniref:Uncharacterized protein n=1 Tax=Streptacidiphilus cavernicola TaxID=3342716 RepID=A0ABV6VQ84_9ACTN